MQYIFKGITTIPPAKDMINIVLSKTQRKTPTVVHPGYSIGRIRGFYMRKIKFTQDTMHEKFNNILTGFPKLDDIHPFFADLFNVLYDKDHYKLALGHIHSCMNLVDNICTDYVRLIKYGESLYRCKQLKRACLGRICTVIKKLNSSLNYLEEVRKHLARLPSINPFERTLMITGYPNVGKSSFINRITNANVEVQAYPFTTQSLYVGHTDYQRVRWQVIDSPGILDHPLEQRNTIEMQSITALAHLKACILFFIDLSEQCSYSVPQQVSLFNSIKPLFKNKPLCVILSKNDLRSFEELSQESQDILKELSQTQGVKLISMSNKTGDGIETVKTEACETLLKHRDGQKIEALSGGNQNLKREEEILRGLHIAQPTKTREANVERAPIVPESVKQGVKFEKATLKEIQEEHGGAGVFNFPLQEHYDLENPDWKYDAIPEIMDGKNIADYVDPDILLRLDELEREEEMLEKARLEKGDMSEESDEDLPEEFYEAHKIVQGKKTLVKINHKLKRHTTAHVHNEPIAQVKKELAAKGIDSTKLEERVNAKRLPRRLLDQIKDQDANDDDDEDMADESGLDRNQIQKKITKKARSASRSRSKGMDPNPIITPADKAMQRLKFKIEKSWSGMAGEADRSIAIKKPKHLYSGKRGHAADRR